jgi:nucleotide-binding universal stress UspA family protein
MYKTILVPLDGSKRAESILRYVEQLAIQQHSKVVLLQVVEPNLTQIAAFPDAGFFYRAELERLSEEAKLYLSSWVGEMQAKKLEVKMVIETGPIVKTILDVAERENADLIALASHGHTGLQRVFYGSVAAGILHQTSLPLLLVRAQ